MSLPAALDASRRPRVYRRREPEHGALYKILQTDLETFLAHVDASGARFPKFAARELRAYLRCGILAHGFARVHCDACGHDRLVAFSCKGRGFCPSCGGKRMTRFAEHLIDDVLPIAPVRQWVLTVPHRLRYRMAYDHSVCREVHRAFIRALQASYRHRALARGVLRGQTGAVTCIQRFGSALNLNPHFHTQVIDGVLREQGASLEFFPLRAPTNDEVLAVLEDLVCRLQPLLIRLGIVEPASVEGDREEDPHAQQDPLLAAIYAGSIQGLTALGERRGHKPVTRGRDPRAQWLNKTMRHHAQLDGFDLHASVSVPSYARDRLEQLLRYCARPAVSHDRLELLSDGRVALKLKTPRFDGTSHLILTGSELIERLISIIPRPQKNLILYSGVLAPRSKLRPRVTQLPRPSPPARPTHHTAIAHGESPRSKDASKRGHNSEWARLMQRAFDIDVLRCPGCAGRMRVLALIDRPLTARRILRHLGMRDHPPPIAPARLSHTADDLA